MVFSESRQGYYLMALPREQRELRIKSRARTEGWTGLSGPLLHDGASFSLNACQNGRVDRESQETSGGGCGLASEWGLG